MFNSLHIFGMLKTLNNIRILRNFTKILLFNVKPYEKLKIYELTYPDILPTMRRTMHESDVDFIFKDNF